MRLGFKRRTTAVLKSSLIRSIEFDTAVARRLKRALLRFILKLGVRISTELHPKIEMATAPGPPEYHRVPRLCIT